jgi:hypothetical protein
LKERNGKFNRKIKGKRGFGGDGNLPTEIGRCPKPSSDDRKHGSGERASVMECGRLLPLERETGYPKERAQRIVKTVTELESESRFHVRITPVVG